MCTGEGSEVGGGDGTWKTTTDEEKAHYVVIYGN